MKIFIVFFTALLGTLTFAQNPAENNNPFKQLGTELPSPNTYRTASGAPGHEYWQQRADYDMNITLDDATQRLYGEETITYHNNSPDPLEYLWLQLDQNVRAIDADAHRINPNSLGENPRLNQLKNMSPSFDGGFKIEKVTNANDEPLNYTIVKTMLRINLSQPLASGSTYTFKIKWWYNINNRMEIGGRSGYEYFPEDDNYLYTIAQFFPRMCSYNDIEGWQNKQFLGNGEFALIFGDYEVRITVPSDHLVASTGELQNPNTVLTKKQRQRYATAQKSYEQPVIIVTQEEATENEKSRSDKTKTWHYKASNVRDFAFASSRKFIWDAMAVKQQSGDVIAMSMYPKEGNPLWEKYSTKAVAHTLKWYSHYTFDYPYPVAWSIHAARIGMEYPMICFNFGRPEKDGTYSARTKYGMIGVIIHEVGHNYFPMIVNSDERQWTWMDEGLNTFLQYLTEQQWQRNFPSRRGPANQITNYMGGDKDYIVPIMTNSESIWQFGNNAYGKPATALNILRETIMGREIFDHAFKTYANRWKFKSPYPADFFRTMEDASAVDLDWFWRGWFFTNDHCDLSLGEIKHKQFLPPNPKEKSEIRKADRTRELTNISKIRNRKEIEQTYDEIDTTLRDFYTTYDPLDYDRIDQDQYEDFRKSLSPADSNLLAQEKHYYEITVERKGGLVMPIIIQFNYADGTNEVQRIPAEIWKMGQTQVTRVFPTDKEATSIVLDPFLETADVNMEDNFYPPRPKIDRFEVFKNKQKGGENPMQRDRRAKGRS